MTSLATRDAGAVVIDLIVDPAASGQLSPGERRRLRSRLGRMVRAAWLSEKTPLPLEVSVRLTDDRTIHGLNREYRGRDQATDVLAFAMREASDGELNPELLGDIVISVDTAARQAGGRAAGRPSERASSRPGDGELFAELLFLCAHGLCHLLGYDHRTDAEEAEMNQRMGRLLAESVRRGQTRAA